MRTLAILVTFVLGAICFLDRKYWAATALFLCAIIGAWST